MRDLRRERLAERVRANALDVPQAEKKPARRAARVAGVGPDPSRERLWTALLVGGSAVAFGLLGRELADAYADRARPAMQQNDIFSAVTSGAILAVIGLFAYRRWRLRRQDEAR